MPKLRQVNGRKSPRASTSGPRIPWTGSVGGEKPPPRQLPFFTCVPGKNIILLPKFTVEGIRMEDIEIAAKAPLLRHPNHTPMVSSLVERAINGRIVVDAGFAITLDIESARALNKIGAKLIGHYRHDFLVSTTPQPAARNTMGHQSPEMCTA